MRSRGVWVPDRACFRSLVRDDSGGFRFDVSNSQLHSRGAKTPELCQPTTLESRGRRECRMRAAPAVSRAKIKKHTRSSPQVHREQPGIPRAMVLTAYFGISPVIGLIVTVVSRIWLVRARSGRPRLRKT